jgi:uncharacterized membrane protein
MKFVILSIFLLFASSAFSQSGTLRDNKFSLELAKNKVSLSAGQSEELTILIQRSAKYEDEEIEFIATAPEGLSLTFGEPTTLGNKNTLTITASEGASTGTKMIIIYGRVDQTRKGVALSVSIQ